MVIIVSILSSWWQSRHLLPSVSSTYDRYIYPSYPHQLNNGVRTILHHQSYDSPSYHVLCALQEVILKTSDWDSRRAHSSIRTLITSRYLLSALCTSCSSYQSHSFEAIISPGGEDDKQWLVSAWIFVSPHLCAATWLGNIGFVAPRK